MPHTSENNQAILNDLKAKMPVAPDAAQLSIQPISPFRRNITLPGSKSLSNRALLLAALAKGQSELRGILFSDDVQVMLAALITLGIEVDIDADERKVTITGGDGKLGNLPEASTLFLGNAGTAFRFMTAASVLSPVPLTLDGIPRMRERPIGQLVDPLREIGTQIDYLGSEAYPPLTIHPLSDINSQQITLKPSLSSQYTSALLQLAPCLPDGLTIHFEGELTSRPYVEMTLAFMQQFGAQFDHDEAMTQIKVAPGGYQAQSITIEPDASNASYFLGAAALISGSKCTVEGLGFRSLQGDAFFAEQVLQPMGASVIYEPDATTVFTSVSEETSIPDDAPAFAKEKARSDVPKLKGLDIDLGDMPDMAQTLAVLALFAHGPTTMRGIGNLRVKETDRVEALRNELTKLGARVEVEEADPDNPLDVTMTVHPLPDGKLTPAAIDTYDDHRMAMAFAMAGLLKEGVTINDPACVAKTFPDYFDYLNQLGPATP